jgi:quercetin dioxygenase-like cupin family protein/phenylpyruvate tautomerase PptA (4-oxalocrotonate tautomerase family)
VEIRRNGSQPSTKGSADYFTGTVRVDPLFSPPEPARASGGSVTFEPGARTTWHTHPLGQALIVTAGCGRLQRGKEPIQEIRPGDVVWTPPGVKRWHGASPSTAMTHIAIQEKRDGKVVEWMEKVADEDYRAEPEVPRSTRRAQCRMSPSKCTPAARNSKKAKLAAAIVKDVMAITHVGDNAVSVAIEEVAPGDWGNEVYKPDIVNGAGKLYKRPGYNPIG